MFSLWSAPVALSRVPRTRVGVSVAVRTRTSLAWLHASGDNGGTASAPGAVEGALQHGGGVGTCSVGLSTDPCHAQTAVSPSLRASVRGCRGRKLD